MAPTRPRISRMQLARLLPRYRKQPSDDIEHSRREEIRRKVDEIQNMMQKQEITVYPEKKPPEPPVSGGRGTSNPESERHATPARRKYSQGDDEVSPATRHHNIFAYPPPRFDIQSAPRSDGKGEGSSPYSQYRRDSADGQLATIPELSNTPKPTIAAIATGDPFAPFSSSVVREPRGIIHIRDPVFNDADFAEKLVSLWAMTKAFAETYTNTAVVYNENIISDNMKLYMSSASDKSTELLSDESTRSLMVAKALNFFFTEFVLKSSIVEGFDSHVDSEIVQMREHLSMHSPPIVRNAMIDAIGRHILVLRNRPLFENFFNKRTHDNAEYMFRLLSPLIHARAHNAWSNLAKIMIEAHTLALHLCSGPYELRFVYPESYHQFDPRYMVDHHAHGSQGPETKRARVNAPVHLAITPVAFFRDAILHPRSKLHMLLIADVLLASSLTSQRQLA